eukprot:TRINITY_DN20034_c0_g1_i1.p1 TRINITY_DN20034_c0_g1~~TRINITY_DN20034_c0_g1_i1.p1  ORF type:complete len:307 (+),score=51.33 TRINITY_DN20034_c0_g1_i1:52-972(+)
MALELFDPHFHIWDAGESSCMDSTVIFKPNGKELYNTDDYERDMADCGMEHSGGVFIEAMSVCFKDKNPEQLNECCKEEGKWVIEQLSTSNKRYHVVLSACLEADNVEETLKDLKRLETPTVKVVGIRQILNFEPSWPRNTANLLENPNWVAGLKLLSKFDLSFDMQINVHQIEKAISVIKEVGPGVPIVINHIGCTTKSDLENEAHLYEQFSNLATLPQVFMKLSMMCYTDKEFHTNEAVGKLVAFLIKTFTPARCMFASNFPVDAKDGWPAKRLFDAYKTMVSALPEDHQQQLFSKTARTFYRA